MDPRAGKYIKSQTQNTRNTNININTNATHNTNNTNNANNANNTNKLLHGFEQVSFLYVNRPPSENDICSALHLTSVVGNTAPHLVSVVEPVLPSPRDTSTSVSVHVVNRSLAARPASINLRVATGLFRRSPPPRLTI